MHFYLFGCNKNSLYCFELISFLLNVIVQKLTKLEMDLGCLHWSKVVMYSNQKKKKKYEDAIMNIHEYR